MTTGLTHLGAPPSWRQRAGRPHSQGRLRKSWTIHPKAGHEALHARRSFQTTAEFKQQYDARAGIEGTISQGVRRTDLRRARYVGLAKTRLQHILCAAAINLCRITDSMAEQLHDHPLRFPSSQTRLPAFVALAIAS